MAYAALLSLSQTLDQILIREQYPLLFQKETLVSLHKNVGALQTFLEEYWQKCRGAVNPLESQIIDVAQHVEDILEYQFSSPLLSKFCVGNMLKFCISICWREPERNFASFQKALLDIDLISAKMIMMMMMMDSNNNPEENVSLPDLTDAPSLSTSISSDINTKVLEDDFAEIRKRLYNKSCNFGVIPIVGMGGIGKSTLARRVYDDCIKVGYFDRCIWVVVSQDHTLKKLLLEIMLSMGKEVKENKEYSDGELKQIIYQELFGRRYMIVVDDLWSGKPWDDLNVILPKDAAGSRVLVTTRLSEVARYVGSSSNPPYEIQLLNEFQSWMLFKERVFGEGLSCPSELEQIGKTVVKSCRGLPLTLVVMAGLLKGDTTKKYWESISKNISSSEPTIALHCSKVLSLSYNHLPLYLRPCFLYATAFPEDYEIKANRLIRLWMAEGFVKPSGSELLEEVAEGYLHNLVGRSLFMVSKKYRYNDRIKTLRIHDVLRNFGASNAQQERFHYHHDLRRKYRRVTTYGASSFSLLSKFQKPATRSVLMPDHLRMTHSFENLRLLRVLDAPKTYINGGVSKFVHLKYLSIYQEEYDILNSTSKLQNIQTLIINDIDNDYVVPLKVWKKPSLRHLILRYRYSVTILEQPPEDDIFEETSLQTIRAVSNLRFTKKVVRLLMNVRKLKVGYKQLIGGNKLNVSDFDLINIALLQKLEKLSIFSHSMIPCFSDVGFPKSLMKLTLSCIDGHWNDISLVGSLPNLQVFKLKWFMSEGGWEPIEGEFCKLKHLEFYEFNIHYWEADSVHFPSLETLVLTSIKGYRIEIPSGIGDIATLKVIKLVGCAESIVDSAKQIQADQWEMGNEELQLFVSPSNLAKDFKLEEIRPAKH